VKVGDILLLSPNAVKIYGATAGLFLGYKETKFFGKTSIIVFVKGRKVLLIAGHIHWTQRARIRIEMGRGVP